mmetsp:Transcript_5530/g.6109  ORF Transcript_5530/g.6109 Transcript_5530/m.6109 type:complete len:667 (+) Transcript_5530:95-2095(+)|eukprot:CAMPEP_0170843046 /NCGR_PEP_ID=MMETSP0734-20130129/6062_1 /TAXON_ID=186038 /ORGANISM="Fragilariopsis kerguelensis, Strain L26-C5" /LENGTH=666 /DNA_ID=CAMNT_0011211215 /DNA_START=1 /DNA_END=2001 /DNA_ORIENTATION=-
MELNDSEQEKGASVDQSSSSSSSSSSHSYSCCPICLDPSEIFVSGLCRHSLCVACMESVLNAKAATEQRWPPHCAADRHLSAPSLGRCPICRTEISLFEVVNSKTLELLYPPDIDSWKPKSDQNRQQQEDQPKLLSRKSSMSISTSTSTRSEQVHPLENIVYIPYRGRPGQFSFHWDWEKHNFEENEVPMKRRPFLNVSEDIQSRPENWRLEDGNLASPIHFMEEGCHFHEPSRTFHGSILWPVPLKGCHEWDIILAFSKDYRFISSGRIYQKCERVLKKEDIPNKYTSEERELCKHPMDGRWTVVWMNPVGKELRSEIHVRNNEFKQSGWSFRFNLNDPERIVVHWPRSVHRQTIVEGVNLREEPLGPSVGKQIRWETSDPNSPDLVWIRQTSGPIPVPNVYLFGMGQDKFLYQQLDVSIGSSTIPKYNGSSVFGNVFTKRMFIGSASYHFLSPTDSFISYAHPACRDLPNLDDGSPLPTRVNFHQVEWDQEERKLTASIEWEKDFEVSWNDNVRWKLKLYFDSEYMVILKGGIQCEWSKERRARPLPPQPPPRHRPPPLLVYIPPESNSEEDSSEQESDRNEEWVMSGYGHDQVYINAASLERYRTNNRESNNHGDVVDYHALGEQHRKRLEKEGATKRSIGFLTHLFHLAAENCANPIDFCLV